MMSGHRVPATGPYYVLVISPSATKGDRIGVARAAGSSVGYLIFEEMHLYPGPSPYP